MILHARPGSFGSPAEDDIDGVLTMFGEVFEALDGLEAEAAQQGQGGIAQGGEHLRGVSGMGARLVLPVGDIAHVVQAVFDAPMATRESQQTRGVVSVGAEAGDGIDGFRAGLAAHDALARQAADLGDAAPGWGQMLGKAGGDLEAAGLDPAVAFLDGLGPAEVRRRRPFR
jgi:hypothetical protein